MLAGIDDPKLDSTTTFHPSSSFHSLPRRVLSPCADDYELYGSTASVHVVIRWSAVGFGFGHNWTSVTVPLSATAETRKNGFSRSLFSRYRTDDRMKTLRFRPHTILGGAKNLK